MSSTSFQDYLNAGTKCMKTGQNWENSQAEQPRTGLPADPLWIYMFLFCQCVHELKTKPFQVELMTNSHPKAKRLGP